MKNNKGFTLVELLASLVLICIAFTITVYMIKDTFATSLTQIDEVSDSQIFSAAENYVLETEKAFNKSGYTCITVKELIDYGYLDDADYENRLIKIIRNNNTKVIETIKYVNICE